MSAWLKAHQQKSLLRFITCGSVDDGKSTLIGRMLYDSKMIFEDQIAQLEQDSKRAGTRGEEIDFALLVDGLALRENRASLLMLLIVSSQQKNANSSSLIHRGMNNTPAIWSLVRRQPNWR